MHAPILCNTEMFSQKWCVHTFLLHIPCYYTFTYPMALMIRVLPVVQLPSTMPRAPGHLCRPSCSVRGGGNSAGGQTPIDRCRKRLTYSMQRVLQCDSQVVCTGAAYARAEVEVSSLLQATNVPFLPTPMGKGLIPDAHPLCVAAARSR